MHSEAPLWARAWVRVLALRSVADAARRSARRLAPQRVLRSALRPTDAITTMTGIILTGNAGAITTAGCVAVTTKLSEFVKTGRPKGRLVFCCARNSVISKECRRGSHWK